MKKLLLLVVMSLFALSLNACSKQGSAPDLAKPAAPDAAANAVPAEPPPVDRSSMIEVYYGPKAEKHAIEILKKLGAAGLNGVEGGPLGKIFNSDRLKEPVNTFAYDKTCDPMLIEKVWAKVNDGTIKKKEYDFTWYTPEQRKHKILIALVK